MAKRGRGARRGGGAPKNRDGISSSVLGASKQDPVEEVVKSEDKDKQEHEVARVSEDSNEVVRVPEQVDTELGEPGSHSDSGAKQREGKQQLCAREEASTSAVEIVEAKQTPDIELNVKKDDIPFCTDGGETAQEEAKVSQTAEEYSRSSELSNSEVEDRGFRKSSSFNTEDVEISQSNSSQIKNTGENAIANDLGSEENNKKIENHSQSPVKPINLQKEGQDSQSREQENQTFTEVITESECPIEQHLSFGSGEEKTTEDFVEIVDEICEDVSKDDPDEVEEFIAEAFCVDKDDDDDVHYIDEEIVDDLPVDEMSQSQSSLSVGGKGKADGKRTKVSSFKDRRLVSENTLEDASSKFEEISEGSIDETEQDEVINDDDSLDLEITGESLAVEIPEGQHDEKKQLPSLDNEAESLEAVFFATENDTDEKVLVEDKDNEDNDEISDASLSDHNLSLEEISDDDLEMSKKRRKSVGQMPAKIVDTDTFSQEAKMSTTLEAKQDGTEEKGNLKKRPAPNDAESSEVKKLRLTSEEEASKMNVAEPNADNEPAFYTGLCATSSNKVDEEKAMSEPNAMPQIQTRHISVDKKDTDASSVVDARSKKWKDTSSQTDKKHLKGKIVQCSINPIKMSTNEEARASAQGTVSTAVFNRFKTLIPSSISDKVFTTVTSASPVDNECSYSLSIGPVTLSDMDNDFFRDTALKGMKKFSLTFDQYSQGILTGSLAQQQDVVQMMRKLKHLQLGNRYLVVSVTYQFGGTTSQCWTGTLILLFEQDSQQAYQTVTWDGKVRAQVTVSGVPPNVSKDFVHIFFPEALSVASATSITEGRAMALSFSSTILVDEIRSCYDLILINGCQVNLKARDSVEVSSFVNVKEAGFEEQAGVVVIQDVDEVEDAVPSASVVVQELPVRADARDQRVVTSVSDPVPSLEGESSELVEKPTEVDAGAKILVKEAEIFSEAGYMESATQATAVKDIEASETVIMDPAMQVTIAQESYSQESATQVTDVEQTKVQKCAPRVTLTQETEASETGAEKTADMEVDETRMTELKETDFLEPVMSGSTVTASDMATNCGMTDTDRDVARADVSKSKDNSESTEDSTVTVGEAGAVVSCGSDKTHPPADTSQQEEVTEAADGTVVNENDTDGNKSSVFGVDPVGTEGQTEGTQKRSEEDGAEVSGLLSGESAATVAESSTSKDEATNVLSEEGSDRPTRQDTNTGSTITAGENADSSLAAFVDCKCDAAAANADLAVVKSSNLEDVSDEEMMPAQEQESDDDDDVVILREDPWSKVVANIDLTVDDNTNTPEGVHKEDVTLDKNKSNVDKDSGDKSNVLVMTDGQLEVNMEVVDVSDDGEQQERVLTASSRRWSSSAVLQAPSYAGPPQERPLHQDRREDRRLLSSQFAERGGHNESRPYSRLICSDGNARAKRSDSSKEKSPTRYRVPSREATSRRRQPFRKSSPSPSRPPGWNRDDERYQYSRQNYAPDYEYSSYRYSVPSQKYEGDTWSRRYDKWNPQEQQQQPPLRAPMERHGMREPLLPSSYEVGAHSHSGEPRVSQPRSAWRKEYQAVRDDIGDQPYGGYRKSAPSKPVRSPSRSLSSLSSEGVSNNDRRVSNADRHVSNADRRVLAVGKLKQPSRRVSHSPISVSSRSHSLSLVSKSPTPESIRKRRVSGAKQSFHKSRKLRSSPSDRSRSKSPHRYSQQMRGLSRRDRMRSCSPRQKSPVTPPRRVYIRKTGRSSRSPERSRSPGGPMFHRERSKSPWERDVHYKRSPSPQHREEMGLKRKIFQSRSPVRRSSRSPPSNWSPKRDRTHEWIRSLEQEVVRVSRKRSPRREVSKSKPSTSVQKWDSRKGAGTSKDLSSSSQVSPAMSFTIPPPNMNVPPPGYLSAGDSASTPYQSQGGAYVAGTMPVYQYGHQHYSYSTMPSNAMAGPYFTPVPPTHAYAQSYQGAYPVIQVPMQQVPVDPKQQSYHPPMQPPPKPPLDPRPKSPSPTQRPSASSTSSRKSSGSGSQAKKNWSMGSNALVFQRILSSDGKGKNS
ncbi:uncharacterized protein LOC101861874 isoform X2 [Aplysia californica]|uniref:Uncharacterized protein LOC101861874 isoform X2 n=1 Tax=Aplysia californica TaxID=6500 RepID=A0ABM1VNV7_APLCA|nr:uncharacterized protein LOC101861874 isoform X2 [Aplysia californica]